MHHGTRSFILNRALVLASCVAAAQTATGQEHLRRPPANELSGIYSKAYSFDPDIGGGLRQEAADQFEGVSGWRINRVEWWGGYTPVPGIVRGHPSKFLIQFYADANGMPGDRLFLRYSSFTETEYYRAPAAPPEWPDGFPNFHYSAHFPTAFVVPATGRYWLSIIAIFDTFDLDWGWTRTTGVPQPPRVMTRSWFEPVFRPTFVDDRNAFVLSYTGVEFGCTSDLDDGSGTGTPDGGVTIDDLVYFIARFSEGSIEADLDDDGQDPTQPDGGVTIEDLVLFLEHYSAGC